MPKGLSTVSVHGGEPDRPYADSITTPIVMTSSYTFPDMDDVLAYVTKKKERFEYGRYGNPTTAVVIQKLKELELAEDAEVFDCGMSSVSCAILGLVKTGEHIVVTDDAYKKTLLFCEKILPRFGIRSTCVKMGDHEEMEEALKKNPGTRLVLSETPTNPYLNIADMDVLAALRDKYGFVLVMDSTFASPYNQQPLKQGADVVIYSATKYLGGHNDLLGGAALGRKELIDQIRDYRNTTGGVMDPMTSYMLIRGLKTLALRMQRLNDNAMAVGTYLESHPKVRKVYYPGLPSHHDHERAKKYMTGFGGVVTFELEANLQETFDFLSAMKVFKIGPSFGGVEALITHPMTISYYDYAPEERKRLGILDELIRMSVGIEDAKDLIADIEQGLTRIPLKAKAGAK
ncbi:MAG: PLP-dependent aspartate aminotransferase family protein [Candidatus Sumerlaeaceae bacterium]|nr:PLP-dependent aspartate aminotransferase family protein [Candidatus Sumerlaeaceae bacterium]